MTGDDSDHFTIDTMGKLSFKARSATNRLDFENPDDDGSGNAYEITVNVRDGLNDSGTSITTTS